MSASSDKAPVAPTANAYNAMKRYYSDWTEQNLKAPDEAACQEISQGGSISVANKDREYNEFLLSSNWVLRPDGLQEFFTEFSKLCLKSEITWDNTLGCFRVRSALDESAILMDAVRGILERIVQPEIAQVPESERVGTFGGKSSAKIQHVADWRTATVGSDDLKAYDKFGYPRELMQMEHQGTWHLSTEQINAGVTITHIMPTKKLLNELQKSSGCTVMVGMDGKSLQIGAATENDVGIAKKKIDRLSKYYALSSDLDTPGRHVLYSSSQVTYMTELRYIAHLSEGLLTNIFLDRTKFPTVSKKYGRIFTKGSVVSKLLYNGASGGYQSVPQRITPAIEKSKATSAFAPFKGHKYVPKVSTSVPDKVSASGSRPSSAVQADLSGVNPQAAPNVARWAKNTALVTSSTKTAPRPMDEPSQQSQDPTLQANENWGGAHEIDPFGTHSSVTASPETTNASSLQNNAPPRDLLSSPTPIPRRAGAGNLDTPPSNDGESDLISFSPTKSYEGTSMSWSMKPLLPSPRIVDGEQQSREFHSTMNQQAPSKKPHNRLTQRSTAPKQDPNPELIGKVSNKLAKILEPLRMFQGRISLKAELGRFVLTAVNAAHISLPGDSHQIPRLKSPDEMEDMLERHSNDLIFTSIVSLSGGDMNHIAGLTEPGDAAATLTWTPSRNSVLYEFLCATSTEDKKSRNRFVVEVNSEDFTYRVRTDIQESSNGCVFMHCLGRTFDIQFTVETTPNLSEHCEYFAEELVQSLTVVVNGTGVPYLSFSNHGDWHAVVHSVRVRRTSVYSSASHPCELNITQVTEMGVSTKGIVGKVSELVAEESEGKPGKGIFPVFYEACIKSTVAERAFAKNRTLEFAEEAEWTGKDLKAAGAFKDLVLSATDLVKQMDGIGYWCDNQQKVAIHGKPPSSTAEIKKEARARDAVEYNFW
ncbi:hypothetical protein PG995_001699 [Apiospora arundinis]